MSSECQVSEDDGDPADAFIAIFDSLPEGFFLGDDAAQLSDEDEVVQEANAVEELVMRDGKTAPGLSDLPDDESRNRVGFARLIGLDRVLRRAHPHAGAPTPPELSRISGRYARFGRFNSRVTDGLLLPRLMDYGAPPHRRDKYESFGVVRVEPDRMDNIDFRQLGTQGWPTHTGKDHLLVACLPFLDTLEDITLERVEKFGSARYRLGPSDNPQLQERVDDAISALDQSGAAIGLLPEGALSEPLWSVWKQRLAATYATNDSQLALIIIGSGPVTNEDPPRNRAVVLDRQGELLWEQDKLCDFTLVHKTIADWELPDLGEGDLLEDITRGDKLIVAETPLGRLAILICEDLQRCETRRVVPRDLGVSHVLVPVFDAPLTPGRWQRFAAERYLNWTGTRVVVANSRVVGNLKPEQPPQVSTALGMSPIRKAGTWDYDAPDLKETTAATEAVKIQLLGLGPPPAELSDW